MVPPLCSMQMHANAQLMQGWAYQAVGTCSAERAHEAVM